MIKRKTFPEVKTRTLLEKLDFNFLHHVHIENISNSFKRRSEIDFIVFHKRGVLLLECKGGDRYERSLEDKNGKQIDTWTFFEGDQKLFSQFGSPFDQVTENLEDLRRILIEEDDTFKNICFAKGIVFPDLKFSDAGILTNSHEITFDKTSPDFGAFLENCFDAEYSKKRTGFIHP